MFRELPPRAPPAPRTITPDVEEDTKLVGRMFRIFGTLWASIGAGVALFAALAAAMGAGWLAAAIGAATCLVGLTLLFVGRKLRADAVATFRDGVEVEAEVVSVGIDRRVRVNGKSPWCVAYRYRVNGETHEGAYASWSDERPHLLDLTRCGTGRRHPSDDSVTYGWSKPYDGKAPIPDQTGGKNFDLDAVRDGKLSLAATINEVVLQSHCAGPPK